jgi:hypothetical protein
VIGSGEWYGVSKHLAVRDFFMLQRLQFRKLSMSITIDIDLQADIWTMSLMCCDVSAVSLMSVRCQGFYRET